MNKANGKSWFESYEQCELCPRYCGVNRLAGQVGQCGQAAVCRLGPALPHHGEEPPLSGCRGSGAIFFSGCPCQCFYCQNYQLSLAHSGEIVRSEELLNRARKLVSQGVHNLNFVTPDHFWPHIEFVCRSLRAERVDIPFIYNCSGYERADLIPAVAAQMQIFLPDFKYSDPELAATCSAAPDYPEVALAALREMIVQRGFLEPFDPSGQKTAKAGVLVRHLVLPGHVDNSIRLLEILRREFGRMLPLSIMSQFQPMPECRRRELFTRGVTAKEYEEVCRAVRYLGFRQVLLQPSFRDSGYVPDFNRRKPFAGNPD